MNQIIDSGIGRIRMRHAIDGTVPMLELER
jgi:hypothetical protein